MYSFFGELFICINGLPLHIYMASFLYTTRTRAKVYSELKIQNTQIFAALKPITNSRPNAFEDFFDLKKNHRKICRSQHFATEARTSWISREIPLWTQAIIQGRTKISQISICYVLQIWIRPTLWFSNFSGLMKTS